MSPRATNRTGFDESTRRAILDDYAVAVTALEELGHVETGADRAFHNRLLAHEQVWTDHVLHLRAKYEADVPIVSLSRCPISDDILHHSFDGFGLDGLWWDHDAPVRPRDVLPRTFLGLTGALRLGGPPEWTPWLVKPGPDAPFVVPHVLEAGAVAVINQVEVGKHTGWAVTYWAQERPNVPLFDEWSRGDHRMIIEGEAVAWDSFADTSVVDFDLGPWIDQEYVFWIEPGDKKLTLWSGSDQCPFVGIEADRTWQRFQYGAAWA